MQNEHELIILNRPRSSKRGLTIRTNGRIILRTQPCQLLGLSVGDKISFIVMGSQMYIVKSDTIPDGIPLSGRPGQLHGCSVNTIRQLFVYITDIPSRAKSVDLIVSDQLTTLTIHGKECPALTVVNRADSKHCH